MIAMAVDEEYQQMVEKTCKWSSGQFSGSAIKGFGRMANKCVSYADHYHEKYPRPSHNIDINRSACTFEEPEDLLSFIKAIQDHPHFGGHPVRSKNMFSFDEDRAAKQFHYRTVMINW